ncbi:hypothetical protein CLU79DRAFT_681703, partial [Phycomyces nitens]
FIVETIATNTECLINTPNESSLTWPISLEKPKKNEDFHMKNTKPKRDYVPYTV